MSATQTIHGYSAAVGVDATADYLLIDPASTGNYLKINRNVLLGITGSPIGSSDTQTLTNKTLGITNTITSKDSLLTLQNASDITKQANFSLANVNTGTTRTYTLPNASVTLASLTGTETFTNKTLTSPTITGGSIDNTTISVDAITGHTVSTTVTVGGVQMANGIVATTGAVNTNSILAGAVVPNSLQASTGTGWSWQSWVPSLTNLSGGTLVYAKYVQIGKTVYFRFKYTLGGAGVAGLIGISLPVALNGDYATFRDTLSTTGNIYDSSTGDVYMPWGAFGTSTRMDVYFVNASANQASTAASSSPMTWAINDQLMIVGYYEAA